MPGCASLAPDKVEASITPDLLFTAHSSLLDLVFYEGDQFPAEYKGSLFVALKGSWNRSVPTGYKVVRVPFKDGRPEGWYENFATGFWASGEQRAEVWGRPAALAVAKDGSLLVADDTGGTIWRISYKGPPPAEHAAAPAEIRDRHRKPRLRAADRTKRAKARYRIGFPEAHRSYFSCARSSIASGGSRCQSGN